MQPAQAFEDKQTDLESTFTEKEFRFIADLVYRRSGIVLADHKKNMMFSRLVRRVRELKLGSFPEYCRYIQGPNGRDEIGALINAMTTNLTKFFREMHHFDFLEQTVIPHVIADAARTHDKRLRIWSAGCSSGEEPYSIAMTLLDARPSLRDWDTRILATDLDTNMVARGASGIYPRDVIQELPRKFGEGHFEAAPDAPGKCRASEALRALIAFKPLNLHEQWPMRGPFDAIFCRNVMIYFDNPTKSKLVRRLTEVLKPGGWLFVGHSETLLDHQSHLKLVGRTIYKRIM